MFPVVKYLAYLQYGILLSQDQEVLDSLVRYGFDEVYEKLQWLDKITALDVASQLEVAYLPKLLDKVACDFLHAEYEEIGNNTSTYSVVQAMGTFHTKKY